LLTLAAAGLALAAAGAADTWPGFRGAGDSHSAARDLPVSWELRGRREGNWTVRLPGYGQSSPVVWKDKIFVTAVSGDEKERLHVLALALDDGRTLWHREFAGTQKVKDSDTVSRGAPTPVVDAERLYAVFESGDVLALTHAGELAWQRSFVGDYGPIEGPHGYASSPVLVDDLCVLQVCHAGPSYVLALDKATGQTRWKSEHPPKTGWSTPAVVARGGRKAVIVSTSGSVRAVDAAGGQALWAFTEVSGNSTPSPTIAGDWLVIGASSEPGGGRAEAAAPSGSVVLRLDDADVGAAPQLVWSSTKASAGYASPLVVDGLVYFVSRAGVLQCVELASGKLLWQHRLPGEAWASPVASGGLVTVFCKHGPVVTLKAGPELEVVAESQVSTTDIVYGIAAIDGSWIVRTGRGLTRIGR
jgi:outer membrane protein assembly factor BamB